MEILKIRTRDGYRFEVLCDFDECAWSEPVDAQQPVWAPFVALEAHVAQVHRNAPLTLGIVKGRVRRIENLELPLELGDLND